MAVFAELHDGRRLEFPDGTAPEVIQGTVRKMLAQAPAAAPAGPQEGMGEAALIAAGRGTDKLVQGVRQAYNWLTNDQATLDQMAAAENEKDALYKPLQEKFPMTTSIGEVAPAAAAGVLTGGTSLLGGAAAGALPSLLSYGSVEERVKRGAVDALGGAGGVLLGKGVARVLKPSGVGSDAVSSAAREAAERIGYRPTAGQLTQSPALLNIENFLLKNPGSSGIMQRVGANQQTALNRAGAKAMGEVADTLDEGVFAAAQGRIGGEFDRLSQITSPDLTGGFLTTLAKVDADNLARGSFASKKVSELVDKGLDLAANNNLDGKAYKEIRTALSNEAQAAFRGGDATTGQAYKSLVSALDDAAKGSLSKADQEAWDVARQQWGAFKTLSKSNVAEAGDVSAARTAAAVRAKGPGLRTGKASGELADIARVGEAFKTAQNPNSGNLINTLAYQNLLGPLMMGANNLSARAYMTRPAQWYMANGLLDVGPIGQGLLSRAGTQTAIPAARNYLGVE